MKQHQNMIRIRRHHKIKIVKRAAEGNEAERHWSPRWITNSDFNKMDSIFGLFLSLNPRAERAAEGCEA